MGNREILPQAQLTETKNKQTTTTFNNSQRPLLQIIYCAAELLDKSEIDILTPEEARKLEAIKAYLRSSRLNNDYIEKQIVLNKHNVDQLAKAREMADEYIRNLNKKREESN